MTLIEGEISRSGNETVLSAPSLRVPVPAPTGSPTRRAVTLGVRPEDVVVGSGPIQARVKVVEPTGHESIVLFDVGPAIVTARMAGDVHLKPDEPVRLGFRETKLHLFDSATGNRLAVEPALSHGLPHRVGAGTRKT
jgi:multiple sugar transport system ATP-binding protein